MFFAFLSRIRVPLTNMNGVACAIRTLWIVLDEIVQECCDVIPLFEQQLSSKNVRMNTAEMKVIREGMQVHQYLHPLTLTHKFQNILQRKIEKFNTGFT